MGFAAIALTGAAFILAGALALAFGLLDVRDFATSFLADFGFVLATLLGLGIDLAFALPFVFDLPFDFTAMTHILS